MDRTFAFGRGTAPVCRLGLATRGNTRLEPRDVHDALARGVNYLNWCGHPDGLSRAVAELGARRKEVVLAWQLEASRADDAARELDHALRELGTSWIDVVTLYYVESEPEWAAIASPGGALEALVRARDQGAVRLIGMTSHQRALAAGIAAGRVRAPGQREERPLDLLMLRYNAAHRGAEEDVFPVTDPLGIPVVAYTCLRWGALPRPTPDDPPGFRPPAPREWYRFALAHPSVAVAICAPDGREELDHDLSLLDDWRPPDPEERRILAEHGDRVRRLAGAFP